MAQIRALSDTPAYHYRLALKSIAPAVLDTVLDADEAAGRWLSTTESKPWLKLDKPHSESTRWRSLDMLRGRYMLLASPVFV